MKIKHRRRGEKEGGGEKNSQKNWKLKMIQNAKLTQTQFLNNVAELIWYLLNLTEI